MASSTEQPHARIFSMQRHQQKQLQDLLNELAPLHQAIPEEIPTPDPLTWQRSCAIQDNILSRSRVGEQIKDKLDKSTQAQTLILS